MFNINHIGRISDHSVPGLYRGPNFDFLHGGSKNSMNEPNQLSKIFCSLQAALLGHVTPNLREVCVIMHETNSYELVFFYDHQLSEDEEELASLVDTEFIADFPSPEYHTECTVKVFPYPKKIPKIGYCVYRRFEE